MADVFDKEKRSSIMQCVRSKGNKSTEIKLLYSLTVAFGMGTIAEILAHPIIKNIGKRNESVTSSTTLKLLNCLRNEVGQLSVSGSAN